MKDYSSLVELERQLHSLETRSSEEKISVLLSVDFFEFGSSGSVWTRDDILKRLPSDVDYTPIESKDFQTTPLGDDVVLVTYVSYRISKGTILDECLRSSIWQKEQEKWRMTFHQGTPKRT